MTECKESCGPYHMSDHLDTPFEVSDITSALFIHADRMLAGFVGAGVYLLLVSCVVCKLLRFVVCCVNESVVL